VDATGYDRTEPSRTCVDTAVEVVLFLLLNGSQSPFQMFTAKNPAFCISTLFDGSSMALRWLWIGHYIALSPGIVYFPIKLYKSDSQIAADHISSIYQPHSQFHFIARDSFSFDIVYI
jgi:hypothetical protein